MGTGVGVGATDEGGYSSKDRMLKDLAEEGSKGWSRGISADRRKPESRGKH